MAGAKICAIEGCGKPVERREWCGKHYQRWKKHGDPNKTSHYEGALCQMEGCTRPARAHGLCGTHAQRVRRHGDPEANPAIRRVGCLVGGCDRPHRAQGYCQLHYDRLLMTGDVQAEKPPRTPPGSRQAWLDAHRDYAGDDCLIWPFSRDHNGYARMRARGIDSGASRVMCEMINGPPATSGLEAAHGCGNGHLGCVHPRHLRWDTTAGNHADKLLHGTHHRGEQHGAVKLSEEAVRAIRADRRSQRAIADEYGVAQTTVSRIKRRRAWAWLD